MRSRLELQDNAEGRAMDEGTLPAGAANITALAWKAQLRLHKTYRRLIARGKRSVVATAAVARELLGFVWSIGQLVPLGAA